MSEMKNLKIKRIIAFIIDLLLIIGFVYLLMVILKAIFCSYMIDPIIVWLFFFLFFCKDCYNGASLGKRVMHIRIIDYKTLKAVSPAKSVIRDWLATMWPVECCLLLFNPKSLRIGDYVTQTRVVDADNYNQKVNVNKFVKTVSIVAIIMIINCILVITCVSDKNALYIFD